MSNSIEEVKALHRHCQKLEEAILAVAKVMSDTSCANAYKIALLWMVGEERETFVNIWEEKLADVRKKISNAQAIEEVLKVFVGFDNELADYMRAEKVKTAEEAMDIAHAFVKKYSSTALPMKTAKKGEFWLVDIDVGALGTKIAKIKVDARTGKISSYEVPEIKPKAGRKKIDKET